MITKFLKGSLFALVVMSGSMRAAQNPVNELRDNVYEALSNHHYVAGDLDQVMPSDGLDQFIAEYQAYILNHPEVINPLLIKTDDEGVRFITILNFYNSIIGSILARMKFELRDRLLNPILFNIFEVRYQLWISSLYSQLAALDYGEKIIIPDAAPAGPLAPVVDEDDGSDDESVGSLYIHYSDGEMGGF